MDNKQIEISIFDDELIRLTAPFSRIDLIKSSNSVNRSSFEKLFGNELDKESWCYFYEQASLSRQFNDWERIIELAKTIESKNLHPCDAVEWMPFVQAYAYQGEFDQAEVLIEEINRTPFYRAQACKIFSEKLDSNTGTSNFFVGNEYLKSAFCVEN